MTFRVPMLEVPVEIVVAGLQPSAYVAYLAFSSELHDGSETLDEYLNGRRRFFPMTAGGAPRMINRDQIVSVKVHSSEATEPLETVLRRPAVVELVDGLKLRGEVPIDRPVEWSRLSDILNDASSAFLRIDEGNFVWYVNKNFIRFAIPE